MNFMYRKQRIEELLKKDFSNFKIEIHDKSHLHKGHNNFDGIGETHMLIRILTKSDININRLKVHRKINDLLKYEFEKGLHSIEIKIN